MLGRELLDRCTAHGRQIKAVSGFDATFSAPKSLSVWWALTGDDRLLDAHDAAVAVTLGHLERFGSTTRIRRDGGRLHPETGGLTIASFRQTTSRADDPQIHTHAVVSAKVQTVDGRWMALDARFLKRHQRMLGGLYQSALRSELTARYGVTWQAIVNGQAELAGVPYELLEVFSKRTSQIDAALGEKLVEFRDRHGRDSDTLGTRGAGPRGGGRHAFAQVRRGLCRPAFAVAHRSRRTRLDVSTVHRCVGRARRPRVARAAGDG